MRSIPLPPTVDPANRFPATPQGRPVFDLGVAHLHRLIALHIITKFPA